MAIDREQAGSGMEYLIDTNVMEFEQAIKNLTMAQSVRC